jgi:hypothetical protein
MAKTCQFFFGMDEIIQEMARQIDNLQRRRLSLWEKGEILTSQTAEERLLKMEGPSLAFVRGKKIPLLSVVSK